MNKREFVASGVGAVVAAPLLAQAAPANDEPASLRALLSRTQRRPDLVDRPGAATFEAYVGERFTIVGGAGLGAQLVVSHVERVARCAATEQFTVSFAAAEAGAPASDGLRTLAHTTGQRLTLHLERSGAGYDARFNLLA
jgi:hypothetical protein